MNFPFCVEVGRWIERHVEEPVRRRRERREERCRRRPWWHPARWFCEIVIRVEWVVELVVRVVRVFVTEVVCRMIGVVLIFAGLLLSFIQLIPVIGGLVKTILGLVRLLIGVILGYLLMPIDTLFRPGKRLRVRVVVLNDGTGPLATAAEVDAQITTAQQVFAQCAVRVRMIGLTFHQQKSSIRLLRFGACGNPAGFANQAFGRQSSEYELETSSSDPSANWRRFLPFGGYVTVFVVQAVGGSRIGCSNGPFYDFVVVEGQAINFGSAGLDPAIVAHELGHACTLVHRESPNALMFANSARRLGTQLNNVECFWVRASPYVTYL